MGLSRRFQSHTAAASKWRSLSRLTCFEQRHVRVGQADLRQSLYVRASHVNTRTRNDRSLYFELSNGDNRIVARQAPVRRAGTPIGGPLLGGFAGPTADDIGGDFRVGFHQRHQLILQGAARDLHRFDRVVFLFSLDRGCRQF